MSTTPRTLVSLLSTVILLLLSGCETPPKQEAESSSDKKSYYGQTIDRAKKAAKSVEHHDALQDFEDEGEDAR